MNDDPTKFLTPPPPQEAKVPMKEILVPVDWFVVLFPDTDLHRKVAKKISEKARPGAMIPMTPDEMALLAEFFVWPPRSV